MYYRWICYYPLSFIATLICWAFGWLVVIPVRQELRTDTVKYYNKQLLTLKRDYLLPCFKWFTTHDNAADEWFYGCYWRNTWWASWLTLEIYKQWWIIRYLCRVFWIYRNSAYGFSYYVLGFERDAEYTESKTITGIKNGGATWFEKTITTNLDGEQAFQIKGHYYITKNWYLDINIGWKSHDGFQDLMYAGRWVSFPRKYKN